MKATANTLPKGMVALTIEVPVEDAKLHIDTAIKQLTEQRPIDGFRPGKAPYDAVKQRFGEMAIYEAALPDIIRKNYVQAVKENDVLAFGQPEIEVVSLVPGNPIVFKATVSVVPKVTSLADYLKFKIEAKPTIVEEKNVDGMLRELQKMQTVEKQVQRPIGEHDKAIVDMDLSFEKVPLEGGQAKNHGVYMDEEYYIPGFKEQIAGLKEGDKKRFTLPFAKDHFQKNLAGRDVDFDVTVKGVYELTHPEINDDFAKKVGQESVAKLRQVLNENLKNEAVEKERQRQEIEILDKIAAGSKFEDIPEIILNEEIQRMLRELQNSLEERGMELPKYLESIKKTTDDLKLEFSTQAVKRVKTALAIREVAVKEKIEISDAELLEEVTRLMNLSSSDPEYQAQLRDLEYQEHLRTTLRHRKTLARLRELVVR
ncbi:MAG: trigger factor [Patescibacteria group bacterium]